jgi:hypothetical protein
MNHAAEPVASPFSQGGEQLPNLSLRSAWANSSMPPSEVSRPPSNAAVTFLAQIAGDTKLGALSSDMAGVALSVLYLRVASTTFL